MIIIPIFEVTSELKPCNIWTVCYPEDRVGGQDVDILSKLLDQWNDTAYLQDFLRANSKDLSRLFWGNISISDAIDEIQKEANDLADEIEAVELQYPGYEGRMITDIFTSFHKNEYTLKQDERRFRKGKPDFKKPMIRLYGIELEDHCMVITGGAVKLTLKMDRPHLEKEIYRLRRVQDYLNSQHIYSKQELEEYD